MRDQSDFESLRIIFPLYNAPYFYWHKGFDIDIYFHLSFASVFQLSVSYIGGSTLFG